MSLSYWVDASLDGLYVAFSGFDEHLENLLRIVVPAIRNPEFTENIFKAERRQPIVDMSGVQQMQPYQHAMMALDTGILSTTVSGRSSVFYVNSF